MLARLFGATLVLFLLELGLFLLIVPWTNLWQHNYFLFRWPELSSWITNYYLRGAVSGLGLIDLGLALRALYQFPELTARMAQMFEAPATPENSSGQEENAQGDKTA
jgi:hypothetical protein